jgi:nucleolar GTP-binding protein
METGPRVTEKDLMWSNGGPGVYACDYRKYYILEEDEWRYDTIPEFMDGKNVLDFFDADIEERLQALEAEEAELEASGAYAPEEEDEDDLDEEEVVLYKAIKERQAIARNKSHLNKSNAPREVTVRGRSAEDIKNHLESHGLKSEGVLEHLRGRKRTRSLSAEKISSSSRSRAAKGDVDDADEADEADKKPVLKNGRARSISVQSRSATRGPRESSVAPHQLKAVSKAQKSTERKIVRYARAGEADRRHYPKLVKHLNSGKSSLGTSTIGR